MTLTTERPGPKGHRDPTPGSTGRPAIYTRVSTQEQRESASLTTQSKDCARYCESKGMVVVAEYVDVQSGLRDDRVQYQKMLADAKAGEFNAIVVWKIDRFGRDRIESGIQLRDLQKAGARVDSATEPNDSQLFRGVLMEFAAEESRRIASRVTANKRTRALEGKRTSKAPFGYENIPHEQGGKTMEPSADAPLVTAVFQMYAGGRSSLRDLRDYISENSTNPKRPSTRGGLHHLLKNRAYVGVIQYGRWSKSEVIVKSKAEIEADIFETAADYEPLIDKATFDKVQIRMENNQHQHGGAPQSPFIFAGKIRCACGGRYTGKSAGRGGPRYYYCANKNEYGNCASRNISEKRMRAAVLPPVEKLLASLKPKAVRTAVKAEITRLIEATLTTATKSNEGITVTIDRLGTRLEALEDGYLAGDFSRERYIAQRDKLSGQIAEAREQLTQIVAVPDSNIDDLLAIADKTGVGDLDTAAWREILEGMLEGIVVRGEDIEATWKPEYAGLMAE